MATQDLHQRLSSVTSHMTLLSTSYQDIVATMRDQNDKIVNQQGLWHDLRSDMELKFTQISKKLHANAENEESQEMQEILSELQQAVLDFDSEQETLEDMRREFDSLITQFLDRADDVIGAAKGEVLTDDKQPPDALIQDLQIKVEQLETQNDELMDLVAQYEADMDVLKQSSRSRESELTDLLHEVQKENNDLTQRNSTLEAEIPTAAITVSTAEDDEEKADEELPENPSSGSSSGLTVPSKKKALYRNNTKTDWDPNDLDSLKNDMMSEMNKMSRAQLAQRMDDQDKLRWSGTGNGVGGGGGGDGEDNSGSGLLSPQSKSPRNSVTMDIRLQVKDIFVLFDQNFDGVLEEEDLRRMLFLFHTDYSAEQLMEMFGPRCEFIKFLRKMQDFREEAVIILQALTTYLNNKIRDVFFIFDKDQTGQLQKSDLDAIFADTTMNVDDMFDPPCSFQDFLFGFKQWYATDSANPHPLLNYVEEQTENRMKKVFEFFDDHKDGMLKLENCQEILGIVGEDRSRAQEMFRPPVSFSSFFKAWVMVDRPLASSILLALESHIQSVTWDEKTGRPPRSLFRSGTVTNWTPDQLEMLKNEMREEHSEMNKQKLQAMVSKQEDLRWTNDMDQTDDQHSLAKDIRLQVLSVFVFFDSDMDAELQMSDLKRMLEAVENKELSEQHVRAHFEPPCDFIKFLKKIQQLKSHALVILQKLQSFIENKIRDVFFIFDEDNDGMLGYGDVERIFDLTTSECDVENLFEPPCDVSTFISGFRAWLRQDDIDPHPILTEVRNRIQNRLNTVFEFFDSSKSGQLSEDDCREILLAVGEDPMRVGSIFKPPVSFPVFVQAWRNIARPLAASILVALENYIDKKSQYHIPEDVEIDQPNQSTNLAIPRRLYRANTKTDWDANELAMLKDEMRGQMRDMAKTEVARMLDEQEKLRWNQGSNSAPTTPRVSSDDAAKAADASNEAAFGPAAAAAARGSIEEDNSGDQDGDGGDLSRDKSARVFRHGTNTSWSSQDLESLRKEMMSEMQDINKQEVKRLMDAQDKLRWKGSGASPKEQRKIRFDPNPDIQLVPATPERKRKDLPAIPSQSDIDFSGEASKSPSPKFSTDEIGEAASQVVRRLVRANTRTNWGEEELDIMKAEMRSQMEKLHKDQLAHTFKQQDELRWQSSSVASTPNQRGGYEEFETESVVNEQMQVLGENPAFLEYKKEHDKELGKLREEYESLERQFNAERRRSDSQSDSRLNDIRKQFEQEKDQAILEIKTKQKQQMDSAQSKYDAQMSDMRSEFEEQLKDMRQAKMRLIENSATQMENMRQMIMNLSQFVKS